MTTETQEMEPRFVREAAFRKYLGDISHVHLHLLRHQGLVSPIKLGRAVLYDLQDADALMRRLKAEQHGNATAV